MIINLLNLFFPRVCLACGGHLGDNESYICTFCRNQLPITNFNNSTDNAVSKRLYGRVNFHHATALLWFNKKGIVQHLMHNLKYKGHEEIGVFLGKWLGEELKNSEEFHDIDAVVPVPLHVSRMRQRGYNQVDKFAREIATSLNVDYNPTVLLKTKATTTQVFKNRLKRLGTAETAFTIGDFEALKNKHLLLIDDIITTGATLEACANILSTIEGVKISVATMAITE